MKQILKIALKFLLAAGIIYYLVSQGKLDFSLIRQSLKQPQNYLVAILFLIIQITLGAYRWKILLRSGTNAALPFLKILKVSWIGLFFSSVLPGAVTGDLIKVIYARDFDPKMSKTFLVMSVLMDRIIGLMGLLLLTGLFSLFTYSEMIQISEKMKYLLSVNMLLSFGSLTFILLLFSPEKVQNLVISLSENIPFLGKRIGKTLSQTWAFGRDKAGIAKTLVISLIVQSFNIAAFWVVSSPFYEVPLNVAHAFTFMPVGLIAVAIPISPAGLGVGHAVFNNLFAIFGIKNGASLFNLHFMAYVCLNLLGIIPYLLTNKASRHHLPSMEMEEIQEGR
jgi:uncharacterized membrane protein YbhN (UPF0104 family)